MVDGDELRAVGERGFDLHFVEHLRHAVHDVVAGEHMAGRLHEVGDRTAVTGAFEHVRRQQRHGLGMVQLHASRSTVASDHRGDGQEQALLLVGRDPHSGISIIAAPMSAPDLIAAAGAAIAAGVINAVAGGGTLVSFPVLVAVGVPAVRANATNTVALCPGYLAGAYAQRDDLEDQVKQTRVLAIVGGIGGLLGSILLVITPEDTFRAAVPWLILLSCGLLAGQNRMRAWLNRHRDPLGEQHTSRTPLTIGVFFGAIYGGFFGAGLGIMLLAILGLFSSESLVRLNATKQALSFIINTVAAVFLSFSGKVEWQFVAVM